MRKIATLHGGVVIMRRDEIGTLPNGDLVIAATDAAGSQIIIRGKETHLLSSAFPNHEVACDAAKSVLVDGKPEDAFGCVWTDMKRAGLVDQLMAVFMAPFMAPRSQPTKSRPGFELLGEISAGTRPNQERK